jgi:DNA mismatch repair protein MutL
MPIQFLKDDVVDQIAAGEVIERPAQLVKELIENALDAGATQIAIDYSSGGREIKIEDNGSGISKSDLPLSVARHATSKISLYEDLWSLNSFGFRGEALASIAAVSRLKIITATDEKEAYELAVDFGRVSNPTETRRAKGTTILVSDLFENVPARLKFMKTAGAESAHIKNTVKTLALMHPTVEWSLKQDGEVFAFWPRQTNSLLNGFLRRGLEVLSQSELFEGSYLNDKYRCEAILSSPNNTVKTSKQIFIFVNGRPVTDKGLQVAVLDAYRGLLMHGEYPTAIIYLSVPADEIDVNVSPTKSQVKFKDNSSAFRTVQRACRDILEKAPWLKTILPLTTAPHFPDSQKIGTEPNVPIENYNFVRYAPEFSQTYYQKKSNADFNLSATSTSSNTGFSSGFNTGFNISEVRDSMRSIEVRTNTETTTTHSWQGLQLIGQVHLTYLVAEKNGAVIFIDQHAAHERVMYEKLMLAIANKNIEVQNYLFPLTVNLQEEEVLALMNLKNELSVYGIEIDSMGPQTIAINSGPVLIKEEGLQKAIIKMSQDFILMGESFALEKILSDVIATMACHSAIRAGQSLSHEEMKSLLVQMDEFTLSSFCPHGRPVFVEYPVAQLERDFGRTI